MEQIGSMIKLAYKKLKGAIYLDKSQLPLIAEIARFEETTGDQDVEEVVTEKLEFIQKRLEDETSWGQYAEELLKKIDVQVFPKKLVKPSQSQIYVNFSNEAIHVKELQFFIKAPVEVHVLGVLWVMTVGYYLDRDESASSSISPQTYGNKLEKNLKNPRTDEFYLTPKLFVPYFSMYTKWRDEALKKAKEILESGKDAMILTMDFKRFFYNVHIPKKEYDQILCDYEQKCDKHSWLERLHEFIYDVMEQYSRCVRDIKLDSEIPVERVFLPIGFYPSNILSNWVLSGFDRAICDEINPVYYGRYVDDILIVDKIERNSRLGRSLREQSESDKVSRDDIINHYFKCDREDCQRTLFNVTGDQKTENSGKESDCNQKFQYKVKSEILFKDLHEESEVLDVCLQNDKVKTFYFKTGASMALLDTFEKHIRDNASMFRMMPDMQSIFQNNDYSELFTLEEGDSPNKLNSVDNVSISAYAVSVLLGKSRKIVALIDDRKENAFEKDIIKIFDSFLLIDQYTLWERLLEIMIINGNWKGYAQIVEAILEAMDKISEEDEIFSGKKKIKISEENEENSRKKKKLKETLNNTLNDTLQCAMARSLSLCWGKDFLDLMKELKENLTLKKIDDKRFMKEEIQKLRFNILNSRMTNRYVTKYPPEFFLKTATEIMGGKKDGQYNLSQISAFYECLERDEKNRLKLKKYSYRPYIIKPEDICYTQISSEIFDGVPYISKPDINEIARYFKELNGFVHKEDNKGKSEWPDVIKVQGTKSWDGSSHKTPALYAVSVSTKEKKNKIRIALGSVKHDESYFEKTLQGKASRPNERYIALSSLLNEAVKQNADILILPESFMPFEWIPDVTRFCATNDLIVITGIEHVLSINRKKQVELNKGSKNCAEMEQPGKKKKVYNLTAVILPYQKDDFRFAHVVYHQKVYPSPDEKKTIEGYDHLFAAGNSYELYHWKDLWFNVLCCFEMASISDRALFRSIPDLTVAVEWNMDVNYYSNIIESLSRDLHRYCAQVNIAQYGDSRLTQPAKTELKDIIKMKGGLEPTVLSADIEIDELREFQIMNHELQTDERHMKKFKPTPPDFDREYTRKKINGRLWKELKIKAEELKKTEKQKES